jgi:hypothetical protein
MQFVATPWVRATFFFIFVFRGGCENRQAQAHVQEAPSPILMVRVAPPPLPHQKVQAKIAALEAKSQAAREDFSKLLGQAMNVSLIEAEKKFTSILADQRNVHTLKQAASLRKRSRSASFLQKDSQNEEHAFAVKLTMLEEEEPDRANLEKLDDLESKRNEIEKMLFQQACREFAALIDIMADELRDQLSDGLSSIRSAAKRTSEKRRYGASSFLSSANVRVVATEKWPMVSELVEDWQRNQDKKELQSREDTLDAEARFVKACNEIMERLLGRFVDDISATLVSA